MPAPIRIRLRLVGDVVDIRVQMTHPMESGRRRDPQSGALLPAHFIQTFDIRLNDRPVLAGQCGPAVARHPVFVVKVAGARAGDRVTVVWRDNLGAEQRDEATIG